MISDGPLAHQKVLKGASRSAAKHEAGKHDELRL
jgi:hypothetical protein